MRLWALSDLHLSHRTNWEALDSIPACPDDWLILAGDVCEGACLLDRCFRKLTGRFRQIVWTPGNHELWTLPSASDGLRGVALYRHLIEIARSHGVLTPEDPYPVFPHSAGPVVIAPLFLLYDYSFRPRHVPADQVLRWAATTNTVAADEFLLHPDPYPDRASWCASRCQDASARLASCPAELPKVLINHFPLEEELAVLPRVPRFTPWCGTRLTRGWHRRFNACAVIYGHLPIRGLHSLDGVPFQEVSLGYPNQWSQMRGMAVYMREITITKPERAGP
ncbi:MAG: metallophosphoesterase [Alphaproteobacteria bacterium]|nr:metallophosphoesterase [Alphaproteobacteria bacterium]